MKFILRSPLHGMVSKYLTLITFTGRKSGKNYTTPVSYSQDDNAEPVADDKQIIASALTTHLRKSPFDARFYDVTIDEAGNPNLEDVEKAVKTVAMIQVQLS